MRASVALCIGIATLAPICAAQTLDPPDYDFLTLAEERLAKLDQFADNDQDGYCELAWGVSYGMMALNVLYEATGEVAYLERQCTVIEGLMTRRDSDLARKHGEGPYVDYQRRRVLSAWGTGHHSGGKHTCWAVHTGMLMFPAAEFVGLVRAGGEATAPLEARAEEFLPQIELAIREFDSEWRDGPQEGMGYYIFPDGSIAPNNQMNAHGCTLFVLHELTGKAEYLDKARKLAAFLKSKLKHVPEGDYYLWAYRQNADAAPGTGEDVSHAAINARFAYTAWRYGASFDDTDMARLTRTFTKGLYLGDGQFAETLGGRRAGTTYTPQLGRWAYISLFDPTVELLLRQFMATHPGLMEAGGTTSALGFAYLLRARRQLVEGAQGARLAE